MTFNELVSNQRMKKSEDTWDDIVDSLQESYEGDRMTFEFGSTSYPLVYYFAKSDYYTYEISVDIFAKTVILSTIDPESYEWDAIADAPYDTIEDIPNIVREITKGYE